VAGVARRALDLDHRRSAAVAINPWGVISSQRPSSPDPAGDPDPLRCRCYGTHSASKGDTRTSSSTTGRASTMGFGDITDVIDANLGVDARDPTRVVARREPGS
jgi:hypothetical protein